MWFYRETEVPKIFEHVHKPQNETISWNVSVRLRRSNIINSYLPACKELVNAEERYWVVNILNTYEI
jgi:hypothetical protein